MSNTNRIELLSGILDECHGTMTELYSLDTWSEGSEHVSCEALLLLARPLRNTLKAAHALAVAISDTSSGWPREAEDLVTCQGERSGYPLDLVSGLLAKAEATTALAVLALESPRCNPMKPGSLPVFVTDSTLDTDLWSVGTQLRQVTNILGCMSPSSDTALAAA
jgi:hypothetical protein